MPKRKSSVKELFQRWMNDIGEEEAKNLQLVGKEILCKVCSKRFSLMAKKTQLLQHLRTAVHQKSVQLKLNPTAEREDEGGHSFYRWIKELDEEERKNFLLDGNCIICNACFKRFSWDRKSQFTQHLETTKHKKSVERKKSAATKLQALVNGKQKESSETKLCVFCTDEIEEFNYLADGGLEENDGASNDLNANDQILKEEHFLMGMLVICKKLQVDSRFATRKKWSGGAGNEGVGSDSFVKNLCCEKCYGDLINLAALREQINKLQETMKQLVAELERSVISSHKTSTGGKSKTEFCFKSRACLKFRKQILKNHQQKSVLLQQAKAAKQNGDTKIFQNSGPPVASEVKTTQEIITTKQQPVVKVEYLNDTLVSSENHQEDSHDYFNYEDDNTLHDFETTSSPLPVVDNTYSLNENDQECDLKEPSRKRKKKNAISEASTLFTQRKSSGRPLKRNRSNETEQDKGKKRKRRKFKIITEESSSSDEPDNQEDEYVPEEIENESDDDEDLYKPTSTKSRSLTASSCSSSSNANVAKIKKIPRRILKGDGPSFRPIYVLNSDNGSMMFLNVKFQKAQDSLVCQHPNCSQEIPYVGYFTDQTAFRMMRLHIQQYHRLDKACKSAAYTDPYHFCCHCEIQLESRVELIRHRQAQHKDFVMPSAICEICGEMMIDTLLADHLFTHKSVQEKQIVSKAPRGRGRGKGLLLPQQFPCDQCDRVCPNATQLRLHRERHDSWEKRKAFICNYCGKGFISRNTLEYHIKRVHFKEDEPTPYVCRICGKKFMRWYRSRYEEHVRSHTNEKPFQCEQCGKSFVAKWNLTMHERTHRNQKIPCEFCNQIYKDKTYLRRHQLKHHPELTQRDPERMLHYEQYKGGDFIGPKLMYPCEPCGHVFVYKSVLVAHLKRMHKMELERNEDYPTMFTWEDSVDIK